MASLSRWVVFIILSTCMFAYTYTYDIPVALQEQLQHYYHVNNVEYTLLFSAYAWPNCVIPIMVGLLTDKVGVNVVIVVCFVVCVIGNGLFVMAIYYGSYTMMLIGRCLYGIGAESFVMAETPLLYEYFKGKELSFALGANLSFSRIGSSVNDLTTYLLYDIYGGKKGIVLAAAAGLLLLIICLILLSALILHRVLYNTKNLRFEHEQKSENSALKTHIAADAIDHTSKDYKSFASHMDSGVDSLDKSMVMRTTSIDSLSIHSFRKYTNISNTATASDTDEFKLSDIAKFDVRFWILIVNTCLIYGCVEPWMKIGGSFMQSVFKFTHQKANSMLAIPYVTSGILTPFIGYSVDRMGHRCHLLLLSTVLLIFVHYVFMIGYVNETLNLISLLLLGVAYSIFCGVIWPSFAVIVHPKTIGTAYGIGVAGYNLCLGIFFIVVGILTKEDEEDEIMEDIESHKYRNVQKFLLAMALFSVVTVLILWWFDKQNGSQLKQPTIKPKIDDLTQYLKSLSESQDCDSNDTDSIGLVMFGAK